MINENILDDNLESIDKPFVRTERIQQIETASIVGSMALLGMQFWNLISYGFSSMIFLSAIIAHLAVFVALIWWRKISIEFDINTSVRRITLPGLLDFLRIIIPLYNGWVLLSSLFTFGFLYNYLFAENSITGLDLSSYILRIFFSIIMAFLCIYYWRITKQSMDFINK